MNFSLVETPEDRHTFVAGAGPVRGNTAMTKAREKQLTGSHLDVDTCNVKHLMPNLGIF